MTKSGSRRPVALVTGGTRGIGLGIARSLGREGFDLAVNGVRPAEQVAEVVASLQSEASQVVYVAGDVGRSEHRASIIERTVSELGGLDVLINNAGITSPGRKDILEADEASFDRVLDVNLKGMFFLTQLAARQMIAQIESGDVSEDSGSRPPGCVINISSVSAWAVSTNRGDYCLTKAAIGMATQLWATRLAQNGIPVYEIQPGIIRSDMTAGVTEKYDRLIAEGLTLEPRWGEPEDVGRAVATLVRGDLPYSTGQVLHVDGGMHIRRL